MKKVSRIFILLTIVSLIPLQPFIDLLPYEVQAASSLNLTPVADAMVRENVPDHNYGAWNDMTIGKAWNQGSYFSNAYSYIKFNLSALNSQSIIHSARLEVYQYVRSSNASGNYLVNVRRASSNWQEMGITWNNKPGFTGASSSFWADGYSGQWFNPPKKYTVDVTSHVREWTNGSPNYGFALSMASGNAGGFWCSKNYNNATCFASSQPRLIIDYTQNHAPNIPNPVSPNNLAEFGGDSSETGAKVTMKVKGLGDPEGNLDGTWFYYRKAGTSNWSTSPKRTGSKTAQFTVDLSDGKWQWRARSRDDLGVWSSYSVTRTFTIDTTPPLQPSIEDEPDYSPGNQNSVLSTLSIDSLIGGVEYMFSVYEDESCSTLTYQSDWQASQEFTINELEHDQVYCYQVKSKDRLGNENSWSAFEKSRQDAILPEIANVSVSEEIFSPNGDGKFDNTNYSFDIIEQHFDNWVLNIKNAAGEAVDEFNGNSLSDSIIWDGRDSSGLIVPDGPYTFELHAFDKAGNESINDAQVVIVDNTPATLNISQPANGAWFNADLITIAGITEPEGQLTVEGREYIVDSSGIFEDTEAIALGENLFDVKATDIVGNSNNEQLIVYRENELPIISSITPDSLINNQNLTITMNLEDIGYNDGTEEFISGINSQKTFLSIFDSSNNEIVLVSDGENVSDIGHIETDCTGGITGGSASCDYSYIFDDPLQPDGEYRIFAKVFDVAGNEVISEDTTFVLDSNTHLEIIKPSEGELFNHSLVTIAGTAERGSLLSASSSQQAASFTIDPSDERVFNCRVVDESFGVGWQGIKEVCDFKVENFMMEADMENDTYIDNNIYFELIDSAGNIIEADRGVSVNLYAVNLSITGDLEYISPNGDGRQDGIDFSMEVYNRDSGTDDVLIDEWEILIIDVTDETNITDRVISGQNSLPPNYYFDGKDDQGNWFEDGEYTYSLWIETTDGIEFETLAVPFCVKTEVDGEVIITNPKDGTVTTKGVVSLQGQAPLGTVVKLCVDMIGIDGDCNDEQVVEVDENGFFSGIVPLTTPESYLWAVATDEAGNETDKSNIVKVILDFSDPLINVSALPSLTGVNQEVILRSLVTQNTEYVAMKFADYTDLSELPGEDVYWQLIGAIDDSGNSCSQSECTWDFLWTTPEVTGGVYEIEFRAKKGETFKTMSVGIRIDGTIPIVPTVLSLINSNTGANLRGFQSEYYTNYEGLTVKGVAEPLSYVHVLVDDGELAEVKSNSIGKWETDISLPEPLDYKSYVLTSVSSDNVDNRSGASTPINIILDKVHPSFETLSTSNPFHQSGTVADVVGIADEAIFSSHVARVDGASFDLIRQDTYIDFLGSFTIESDVSEGEYLSQVFIEDIAGNISSEYLEFTIDNTSPEGTEIDTGDWGKSNGIKAERDIPAQGRLVPEYVIRNNKLMITGRAEQYAKVGIWLSSYKIDEIKVSGKNCSGATLAYSDFYYPLCDWEYELQLGAFEKGYIIQVKVVDRAGNGSGISKGQLVYYDKTAPVKPSEIRSSSYWDEDGLGNVTNNISVTLKGEAERLSDTEIWVTWPSGEKKYYFLQTDKIGYWQQQVNLGNSVGQSEDGHYTVQVKSTDAAGNGSKLLEYRIERDTVKPAVPSVSEPYACGNSICIKVSGEIGTYLYANGVNFGKLYSNNQVFSILHGWKYDTLYNFDIYLRDRARNNSDKVTRSIEIEGGWGMGDVEGATSEDPYAGKKGSDLEAVRMDLVIHPDGSYDFNNLSIPAPTLTRIFTTYDDKVEVYGVGIEKNHRMVINIYREYMTMAEAKEACEVGYLWGDGEKECVADKMGFGDYGQARDEILKQCFYVNPICINDKENNWRKSDIKKGIETKVQHSKLSIHKDEQGDPYVTHLWNDAKDGRFHITLKLNKDVSVGEYLKAKSMIWGESEIDGIKTENWGNWEGLASGWGNSLVVDKSNYVNLEGHEAKVLDVPYFNQYVESDGTINPTDGNIMCGAAASVMITGYYKKVPKNGFSQDVKHYMYKDEGQGLVKGGVVNGVHICHNGAFGMTGGYNSCGLSSIEGMKAYLSYSGLNSGETIWYSGSTYNYIKESIDNGNPLILTIDKPVGHVLVATGYTKDGFVVVNDPYRNVQNYIRGVFDYSGKEALYSMDHPNFKISYVFKVY
jgi:flagellar hook assembly protein FlgD